MLRKHARTIALLGMDVSLRTLIRQYFYLPRGVALTPAMYQRGLGQADLVLALLRVRHPRARHFVELLIGHPILVGEPCLLHYHLNGRPSVSRPDENADRKIVYVQPDNPRQPHTEAFLRWPEYRVGRTVAQLRVRGVRRRDMRRAVRMGWIRFEEMRA